MNKQLDLKGWEELSSKANYTDTLYLNKTTKSLINKKIQSVTVLPFNPKTNDIILGIHIDNIDLYLNRTDTNCWIRKDKGRYEYAGITDDAAYFLKWKSGYFNTLPLEDLREDATIKKYGIPKDYRYTIYTINEKRKECTKALVIF